MSPASEATVSRLTENFDFHDPEYTPETAETVNRLIRGGSGVAYSSAHGGMWVLSRYEHVRDALRDHATFSSAEGVHFPRAAGLPKFSPIDHDPPEHGKIRNLMAPPVRREVVRELEPAFRKLSADLAGNVVARGGGDLVSEVSRPFAIGTLALTIGLSQEAQGRVRELTKTMWKYIATDPDATRFWPAYHDLLSEEIRKAKEDGSGSYLAWLAGATVDGEPIPDDLLYSIIVSYFVAGHDNTMNAVSRLLWHLSGDRELQKELRERPDLRPLVAEESLRRWCPTDRFTRVTTRDVTIEGVTIPQGSRVVLLFDSANRDPDKFPEPEEFNPERGNSYQHLSFGHGIHHCMGAHLSRMEFRTILDEFARQPFFHRAEESRLSFENGRHILFDRIQVVFEGGGPGTAG
ncbi:cytochrome P450 [Nocardiopsis valliformis]|uniref:cytochrome P450 n=1 Tax=Nocardiopsis valliformis TaxID=239974 RepID=UPI00034D539A|nr:cytochrome P450 [Nocardiopsis valliformis]